MIDRPIIVPRQERLLHRQGPQGLGDRDVLQGDRPAPDRPLRRQGLRGLAQHRPAGPRRAATCSASTPRAPAAPTAGSTAAAPASPAWCSRRSVPVVPVAMVDTDTVMPIGTQHPAGAPRRHRHRRAARLLALRRAWRATASSCARSPTRSWYELQRLGGQEYVDVYASIGEGAARRADRARLDAAARRARRPSRRTAPEGRTSVAARSRPIVDARSQL